MLKVFAKLRVFWRAREGIAAVEFALVMPIMLVLYLGSIEASTLVNVDQRVTVISATAGDLTARANGSLTWTQLKTYFAASEAIIAPYSTAGLAQVVSFVQVNTDGTTKVLWSVGYNGGVARPQNVPLATPNTLPPAMSAISRNNYVVISETWYPFRPLLGLFFKTAIPLYRQAFYLPRYPGIITYDPNS